MRTKQFSIRIFYFYVGLLLLTLSCGNALAQSLFFENFEQFTNGTTIPIDYRYIPVASAAGASAHITRLETTTVTMTNLAGSIRAIYDCPSSSDTSNFNDYGAILAVPQTNQVLVVSWQLFISSVNMATPDVAFSGGALFQLPIVGNDESTVVAFSDGGQIFGVTNVLSSEAPIVTIGSWSNLVGTVMSNQLVLNYPSNSMTFSVNGNLIATLPMRPDLIKNVDHVTFEFDEQGVSSAGNTFALDEISVGLASAQPTLGLSVSGGLPNLRLSGLIGSRYTLDYVPELGLTNNWQALLNYTNILLTNGTQFFLDTSSNSYLQRFYRAQSL